MVLVKELAKLIQLYLNSNNILIYTYIINKLNSSDITTMGDAQSAVDSANKDLIQFKLKSKFIFVIPEGMKYGMSYKLVFRQIDSDLIKINIDIIKCLISIYVDEHISILTELSDTVEGANTEKSDIEIAEINGILSKYNFAYSIIYKPGRYDPLRGFACEPHKTIFVKVDKMVE